VSRAFAGKRLETNGISLYVVDEGAGPAVVLLHGFPDTADLWRHQIAALTGAGFRVIAPDLRGFGDSDLAEDGYYDVAAYSLDLHALVHDLLGHDRVVLVGGDLGGVVCYDYALRAPGEAVRMCFFNTIVPLRPELLEAAGVPPERPREERLTADYFIRQGTDGDGLIAELDSPERRRAWVAAMYGHRLWAAPGHFSADDVAFMTEPFADAEHLRASWGAYESAFGAREIEDVPRLFEPCPVPTLVLYGEDDHVLDHTFPDRCRVAFPECIGPFVLRSCGHFVQWEAADVINTALTWFCKDLLAQDA
jgi:pimeloyl-ACP methyl ester carboxylesterase